MIKVFEPTETDYSSNGDKLISPLKAKIHKEDNGDYYLDLEAGLEYIDFLVVGNILDCNTPTGQQPFRISEVNKKTHRITLRAKHVFYDSENYVIADSYVVEKSCNDALDHLNSATDNESPFTTISDVTTTNTFRCVRKTLAQAIDTVIERWGGHLERDNWTIGIRASLGADTGVTIRYGKNLKEITAVENWDNVCTKLLPVGKDGILLDELYLYSEQQYDRPFTKVVSFTQELEEDDYKDADGNRDDEAFEAALKDDLRAQGAKYLEENQYPQVNYTLKANLEKITDIGDTVEVIDERLGISILTHVISYEYDPVSERYTSIEFGNFQKTLSGLMSTVTSQTHDLIDERDAELTVKLNDELNDAASKIWGALGNSYCIYEGDKILVVDKLPKEDATNVIMINSGGIAFSNSGINGDFVTAWTIDGTFNAQAANIINFTADMIKGGTIKLGSNLNENGTLEIYDKANYLISRMDNNGITVYGHDGSYVLINSEVGFAGYNNSGTKIYWSDKEEFHMKRAVVEDDIVLVDKMRIIPIKITDDEGNVTSDGMGFVSTL